MHPESKVYIGGFDTDNRMQEMTGEHVGKVHRGTAARRIEKEADITGHSIHGGSKELDGYNLGKPGEPIAFHVSVKRWSRADRTSTRRFERIAEAAERRIGLAPIAVVVR